MPRRMFIVLLPFVACLTFAHGTEPWFDSTRYSKLNADQKKWIEEREPIRNRIYKLDETDSDAAINLTRQVLKRDLAVFGEEHEEMAKALYFVSGRFYRAGEFQTALDLKRAEMDMYGKLFGKNNWRYRSADFKLYMWQQVTQQGRRDVRSVYGDAWNADSTGGEFYDVGKYREAAAEYELAARHLSRVGKAIGLPDDENVEMAKILLHAGKSYLELANYDKADQAIRASLAVVKKVYGDEHPVYADTLLWLANNHQRRGETPQAELAFRDALAVFEKAYDYPHRDQVSALLDLGRVYSDQKKYGLAEQTYLRAQKLLKEVDDPYTRSRLTVTIGLCSVARNTNRLDEAEKHAREAIEFAKETYKEVSQDWVNAAQELSVVLGQKKKYAEALELSEKAMTNQIQVTGGRHPYAAIVAHATAGLRRSNGKLTEAEELYRGVLSNYRRNYGDRYPSTINTLNNLCDTLTDIRNSKIKDNKLDEARNVHKSMTDIRVEVLTGGHWAAVGDRLKLAYFEDLLKKTEEERKDLVEADRNAVEVEALLKENKFKEALPLAEQVVKARTALPAGSLMLAEARARLGFIQNQLGDYAKSEESYRACLDRYVKLFEGTLIPPIAAQGYQRLGEQTKRRGELATSLEFHNFARELYRRHYGKRSIDYLNISRDIIDTRIRLSDLTGLEADSRELVDLSTKQLGPDHSTTQANLNDLATVLSLTNQPALAEKIVVELVAKSKPAAGPPSKEHLNYMNNLGLVRSQTGKFDEAAQMFEQCASVYGDQVSTSDASYAAYVSNQATARWEAGQIDKAEPLLRQAIALNAKLNLKHEKLIDRLIALLNQRAGQQLASGKMDEARKLLDETVALAKKEYGNKHPNTLLAEARAKDLAQLTASASLIQKAESEAALGKYTDAFKTLESARAIREKLLTAEHPETAAVSLAIGKLLLETGDEAKAEETLEKAAALLTKSNRQPEAGLASSYLGLAKTRRGRCAQATEVQAGVEVLSRVQADHPLAYAEALLVRSEWLLDSGDAPEAESTISKVAAIRSTLLFKLVSRAYFLKARIALTVGDDQVATQMAVKAVEMTGKANGEASVPFADALALQGLIALKMGNLSDAEKLIGRAIQIRKTALPANHPALAANLYTSARLAEEKRDYDDAVRDLQLALAIREKEKGDVSEILFSLATVLHKQVKLPEAGDAYLKHLETMHQFRTSLMALQTDFPLMQLGMRTRASFDRLLSLPPRPTRDELVYNHLLRLKGAASERASLLHAARNRPELAVLFRQHEELAIRLATTATRIPFAEERAWWYARTEALTDQWERLEREILSRAMVEAPKRANYDDVRKALPAKSVLVDFVEYSHFAPREKGSGWNDDRRLIAFIVRPDKPLQRLEMGSAGEIGFAIQSWRKVIKRFNELLFVVESGKSSKEDQSELQNAGKDYDDRTNDLFNLIWKKLAPAFEGIETAYVSPDGEMALMPFGALTVTGDTFALEKYNVIVVPVPGTLPRALAAKGSDKTTLLAMGGIDFNATPEKIIEKAPVIFAKKDQFLGSVLFDRPGLNFLLQTGPEVQGITKTYRARFNESAAVLRMAREATENEYRNYVGQSSGVHLATHGFFIPKLVRGGFERIPNSAVHLSAPGNGALPRILYEPGLFSGLTLAGASEANDYDQDDGILWSFEIASRDLRHVNLAVLSACDTADGIVVPGEGVVGVQRAFHLAGARNVISTLWPVNDLVARQAMERMYVNIHDKKMSTAEALREAQLWLMYAGRQKIKKENDPKYPQVSSRYFFPRVWAPFVLSLDAR